MDKINNLIENFSEKNRIKFENNLLFVQSAGSKIMDIIAITFFGTSIIAFLIFTFLHGISLIYLRNFLIGFIILIGLFLYVSLGDNNVYIDFLKKEIIIQKRAFILRFIPQRHISFENIRDFKTKEEIYNLEDSFLKFYNLYLVKHSGLKRKIKLLSFGPSERNNSEQLKSFLKKMIVLS